MEFLRHNVRQLAVSGGIIIVLLLGYHLGWLAPVQRVLGWVIQPAQESIYSGIERITPLYTTTADNLQVENGQLKTQLVQLSEQNYQLQTKIEQYEDYQNQIKVAEEKQYNFLPAKIISRVGQGNTLETLTINQGVAQGVTIGSPVVYNDGVLIGLVYQVDDNYAEVTLLTNSTVKLQALVMNDTKTTGLLSGAFGTGLILEYILKEQAIRPGDVVITRQDQHIPEGLIVGTVQSVNDQSSELFKTAMIVPVIHYDANSIVSVVTVRP